MVNEIRVNCSLNIKKGNLQYQSLPAQFTANMSGSAGPAPGQITATTGGTNVSLASLTTMGGVCRIQNLDLVNFIDYGIWNGSTYFPLGEVGPGESWPIRLSRFILFGATGTAAVNSLRIRANGASCKVLVEAFDP